MYIKADHQSINWVWYSSSFSACWSFRWWRQWRGWA